MINDRLPLERLPNNQSLSRGRADERLSESELADIKREIGRRLTEAFGTTSYTEIAEQLKITPAGAKLYVDGKRFPAPEVLLEFDRLRVKTGRGAQWLLTGREVIENNNYTPEQFEKIGKLARDTGRTFAEQEKLLVVTALEFLERISSERI